MGPTPHIAVGGEVQAGHRLVRDAIAAVEALPPLLTVGDVEPETGRDPDVPDCVRGDRHDAGARLDRRLARFELLRPDLERLIGLARGAERPAISHDPDPAAGR